MDFLFDENRFRWVVKLSRHLNKGEERSSRRVEPDATGSRFLYLVRASLFRGR